MKPKDEIKQAIDLVTYGFAVTEVIKETGEKIRIDPRKIFNPVEWPIGECDPVADIKNAINKLTQPDTDYWKRRCQYEQAIEWATNELIKSGMSPKEVAKLYSRYGIWPS